MLFTLAALAAFAMLSGCSTLQQFLGSDSVTEPELPSDEPAIVVPVPVAPNRIAILLSDDIATNKTIAEQIIRRGPQNHYKTINLERNASFSNATLAEIRKFDPDKIVAIGLLAAKAGRQFSDTPMVFCQVFNYQDHNLLSRNSKGVKLLPPFSLQLEIWKELSPDLNTIGLIAGPDQDDLVAEIEQAAAQYQVKLLTRTVQSDKEALYAFKRLTAQIQGFLLLPDNRILSPRVLREIISYGRKHGNQTVVYSPQLLGLGAEISFSSSAADVADAVLKVLGGANYKVTLFGPPMTPLTTLRTKISSDVPEEMRSRASAKLAQYQGED